MKKLLSLILTLIFIVSFSFTVACETDESLDSSSKNSASSSSSPRNSSSTPSEPSFSEDEPLNSETPDSSSQENIFPVPKTFFQATNEDVYITSTLSEDKRSVTFNVIPLLHIYKLKIKTILIVNETITETFENLFEKAIGESTITFTVGLSDSMQGTSKIQFYTCDVVGGQYDAQESESDAVNLSASPSSNRLYATIELRPIYCLYNATVTVKLYLNKEWTIFVTETFHFDILPGKKATRFSVYLPYSLIEQGATIKAVDLDCVGTQRIGLCRMGNPNELSQSQLSYLEEHYWTRFYAS